MTQRTPDDLWCDFPLRRRRSSRSGLRPSRTAGRIGSRRSAPPPPDPSAAELWRAGRRPGLQAHRGSRGPTGQRPGGPSVWRMASVEVGMDLFPCYICRTV
jgi:hypothetical protein